MSKRTSNIEHPTLNIEVEEEEIYRKAAKVAKGRREGEEWGMKFFNGKFKVLRNNLERKK